MKLLYPDPRRRRPRFELPGSAGAGPQPEDPSASPGDLPNPGVEPTSPAMAGGCLTSEPYLHLSNLKEADEETLFPRRPIWT